MHLTFSRTVCLHLSLLLVAIGLSACSKSNVFEPSDAAPANPRDVSNVQNAVPRTEAHSRYGNPDSYVVYGKRYHTRKSSQGYKEKGGASWYGTKFHGRRTSSGEPYDMYAMTAAHKTLPLPSYVEVTNLDNGRKVIVRVNDRGPFHDGRIIDMSYAAAVKLGMLGKGTAHVEVRAIDPRTQAAAPAPKKTSTAAATSRAATPSQPVAATAPATQTATTAVPVPASAPPVRIDQCTRVSAGRRLRKPDQCRTTAQRYRGPEHRRGTNRRGGYGKRQVF